jgi:hypothetical protein
MRRVLRPALVCIAIVFLIEAWLWDRLEPVVAAIVEVIPLKRLKAILARGIEKLPPICMLGLLALPAAAVLPLKFLAVWLMSEGAWLRGVCVFLFAKTAALGTTAFVFDAGREKLLQLQWFRKFHDWVIWLRRSAHELVDPIMHRLKYRLRLLGPRRVPRAFRLLQRIRRRMHVLPPVPAKGIS